MEHVIHGTLAFLEERCHLVVSRSYSVEPFPLKGSLGMLQQRLGGAPEPPEPQFDHHSQGEELPRAAGAEGRTCSSDQSKGHLIEELASTELPEEPSAPVYELVTLRGAEDEPLRIELSIQLPQVSSAAECDLSISKDDIIIEVPEKYKLHLDLPELVDEETTTAVFNKAKRVLFISAPVAKPDP
ncbi:PIHD2 protein, partial [Formicarius rufipectus]|nr:PIHD2 protein [Formicarius rufipectus]